MARYGQAFKNKVLAKLLPPSSVSLEQVSQEVGVSVDTLERWRAEALNRDFLITSPSQRSRSLHFQSDP
jgi:hypothetical protein